MAKKSSKQELEDSRRARAEKLRSAQQKQERRRGLLIWGAVGLVVVLIAGGTTYGVLTSGEERDELIASVEEFEVTTDHVQSEVTYAQTPPVGGRHNPVWLNCGVYEEPVQNENAVHALEHGAVWITYDPELPEDDVETLRDAIPPTYAILSPFPDLPAPVVASAWGKQVQLDGADDPRLEQFIREYSGSADVPEPGALCTGGTDTATPLSGEPVEG
jgi:hypothetical protein